MFIVDPDIDVFSDAQMDWALATRFQPDRDLVLMSGMRTLPLDPSLQWHPHRRQSRLRLTLPFGNLNRMEAGSGAAGL